MRIFSIIFLLELAGCALCESCPSSEIILPCTCTKNQYQYYDALITCNNMTIVVLKEILSRIPSEARYGLVLQGMNLGSLPPKYFEGFKIVYLHIKDCALHSLTQGTNHPSLIGLEPTLKGLQITNSFTTEEAIPRLNLRHLYRLKELKWSSNRINHMGNDWFDDVPASLELLQVTYNGIQTLGNKVFANLTNLKTVFLAENNLNSIQRSMFPIPAERLERLRMDHIPISKIPEDIFSHMPSLKSIDFIDMNITKLLQNMWKPALDMNQLKYIILEGNPLLCDSNMNWLTTLNTAVKTFYGKCENPQEEKGKDLSQFINDLRNL